VSEVSLEKEDAKNDYDLDIKVATSPKRADSNPYSPRGKPKVEIKYKY
jgi:hypothetical protein